MRGAAIVALLALVGGCGSSASTGIVVEVSSDLDVPADTEVHLVISSAQGAVLRDLPLRAGDLPRRLELVPEHASGTSVTVEATLASPPLGRRATVAFREGALLLLRLPLEAMCVCRSCPGQTCEGGSCIDVLKDPATLPAYSPGTPSNAALKMAVPVCMPDGAAPSPDAGDAAPMVMTDGGADTAVLGTEGGVARPADAGAPEVPALQPDVALPADGPALTPDAPILPADVPAPPPDLAADTARPPDLAPDSGPPPPDLPGLRADGQPCTTSDQCLSNACVDQVCCYTACTGPCLACDNLHTGAPNGQCAPVLASTDPDGDCAADVPMTCGYDGLCDGAGACRFYPNTTRCAAPTCSAASTFTPARNCTGAGACSPPAPQNCGLFLCTPTGCPVTCQAQSACVSTAYCNGNTCVPKKAALAGCSADYECLSNNCLINATCL